MEPTPLHTNYRLKSFRTKIVATVGPACESVETMARLLAAGVDVFRINMAHGTRASHEQILANIRVASRMAQRVVGVLVDLAGPKIRLGQLVEDPLNCLVNDELTFVRGDHGSAPKELVSNYEKLIDELEVGDRVMLADGTVSLRVLAKDAESARCLVDGPGTIRSRQGINLPGVRLSIPAMSEADLDNARWAASSGVDFISLSFVRTPDEVRQLGSVIRECGADSLVIAKIEKSEALDCLADIVLAADGVMVARGDLGVEVDFAQTPIAQKKIIRTCAQYAKPVIVATQMLDSMQHSSRPTRAEVSDVANAILDGADACMLSGETAIGKYPVEAVETMARVMAATESMLLEHEDWETPVPALTAVHPITAATVTGADQIARQLHAALLVIATHGGSTARVQSKLRHMTPIVGVSDSAATLRRLCLFWGVTPLPSAPVNIGPQLRQFVEEWGKANGTLQAGDRVIYVTVSDFVTRAHNGVVVQEVS